MKLFSADQIRKWDAFTIREQGIPSIDLMERAALASVQCLSGLLPLPAEVFVFAGMGNNGGDGLAIARILRHKGYKVHVFILANQDKGSEDFEINLKRLSEIDIPVTYIRNSSGFPPLPVSSHIIDALYGTGLSRPLSGLAAELVNHINRSASIVYSIDIPSGMFADQPSADHVMVKSAHTLSFQILKRAFIFADGSEYAGKIHVLDIGLSKSFEDSEPCDFIITDKEFVRKRVRERTAFSHKGSFGHAAIIAGSYGMMGAALLAVQACLRSGAGKLTCYVPSKGYAIMQSTHPEAMCKVSGDEHIGNIEGLHTFDAVGAGPGLGRFPGDAGLLEQLVRQKPSRLIIDADALNILAASPQYWHELPSYCILTPHPGEFDRISGVKASDWERLNRAIALSAQNQWYILLKGKYSRLICPDGKVYINPTGNPGMAKGGSGDVLTGLLTGLAAQGYSAADCMIAGAYLHGLAGDIAASRFSEEGMTAADLANAIPEAWKQLLPDQG